MTADMPFQNILNFRDVGSTVNATSKQHLIKPGLFFRSGLPDEASSADRTRLTDQYKIKTIIDLRTDSEHVDQARKHKSRISSSPPLEPSDPAKVLRVPHIQYRDISLNGHAYSGALIKQLSYWNVAKLAGLYSFGWRNEAIFILGHNVMAKRGLIGLAEDSLKYSTAEVKKTFDVLSNANEYPLLVHCTQGKDRTGLVVLLVLLLLQVPHESIEKDYMMSERELASEREARLVQIRSIGLPDEFAGCDAGWVEAITTWLTANYGGIQQYLQTCDVSRDQQKQVQSILGASTTKD